MKLKLDEAGHVVVADGKPVYVHDDGKEIPFDAPQAVAKIGQLNGEAKKHRETAESLATKMKDFEGLDSAAARKALETVSALDQKKLIDAGEVEKVRSEISKVYETRLSEAEAKRLAVEQALTNEMIGGNFARSKFTADKLAIPSDLVQARFGNNFKIENGKVVATDPLGNKIYSRSNPGDLAGFDEALEILVENYPHKDSILKGSGAQGSGSQGGKSGSGNSKQMSRSDFNAKNPAEQAAFFKAGGTLVD